jgi:hypothetical protein
MSLATSHAPNRSKTAPGTHHQGAASCHCLQQTVLHVNSANLVVKLTEAQCDVHDVCNTHVSAQVLHRASNKGLWWGLQQTPLGDYAGILH